MLGCALWFYKNLKVNFLSLFNHFSNKGNQRIFLYKYFYFD